MFGEISKDQTLKIYRFVAFKLGLKKIKQDGLSLSGSEIFSLHWIYYCELILKF